jgi:hypothetical protein
MGTFRFAAVVDEDVFVVVTMHGLERGGEVFLLLATGQDMTMEKLCFLAVVDEDVFVARRWSEEGRRRGGGERLINFFLISMFTASRAGRVRLKQEL